MHIVMVTPFVDKTGRIDGGVAGVSKYLSDEFVKRKDIKVTIVIPNAVDDQIEQFENITVYRIGKKGPCAFLPAGVYELFVGKRQLDSFLRQLKPDIVHFHTFSFLAAICRWPCVLTIHGIAERDAMWNNRKIMRWVRWLYFKLNEGYWRRRVKYLIVISEYIRKFIPKNNSIRKTWLIENPAADSYFDVRWDFEPGRIFACGKIILRKNTLGMIKAFNLVLKDFPAAHLRIAGTADAAYLTRCKDYIKKNGLNNNVHFLGSLNINQIQVELSKANCLLMPSFQETAPLSIEEAMAVGVPVVGSNICGLPYMIENGKTGFLVNQFENTSIAEGICKILSDSELAHSMSIRAKQIASERFRASGIARKTLEVYREIFAGAHI
jgi:glycosyltransferase involved in cell wall biosynthesis